MRIAAALGAHDGSAVTPVVRTEEAHAHHASATAPEATTPPADRTEAARVRPRRRARRLAAAGAALVVGAVVTAAGYAIDASGGEQAALGPGVVTVEIGIHHSRFDIGSLRVREGTLVRFVVHNDDPIDHELVVGTAEVHRRHAQGTERRHPPVPGEVSVAPGDEALTFYEFTDPGTIVYACHLPDHEQYGMRGTIEVVPAR